MSLFMTLAIAALLGLIPANIAKKKGRSFGLWWFYGWMLFIVALPHALLMQDQSGAAQNYNPQVTIENSTTTMSSPVDNTTKKHPDISSFDHVIKYKELLDAGVITEEEFENKKKELLGM